MDDRQGIEKSLPPSRRMPAVKMGGLDKARAVKRPRY
jgi:hypothetical protein